MLDLGDLLRWAAQVEAVADDVRAAQADLGRALTATAWTSTAAQGFAQQAAEHRERLARCAVELDEAATDLRRHHASALAREQELGAAGEAMLTAAQAAAGAGARAVADAMAGAERAFYEAARAAAELARSGRDAVGWVVERVT